MDRADHWATPRLVVAVLFSIVGCSLLALAVVRDDDGTPTPPAAVNGPPVAGLVRDASAPTPGDDRSSVLPRVRPVELEIPSIGVHTSVLTLGLRPDRTLEVPPPEQADQAGWYRYSPTPGRLGPSVIVGHVDSESGPAVFYELATLEPGDEVRVRWGDDVTAVFSVDRVAAYPKDAFPTRRVYADIDHAGLRLITCGGSYIEDDGGYQDNTVVYASLQRLAR